MSTTGKQRRQKRKQMGHLVDHLLTLWDACRSLRPSITQAEIQRVVSSLEPGRTGNVMTTVDTVAFARMAAALKAIDEHRASATESAQ